VKGLDPPAGTAIDCFNHTERFTKMAMSISQQDMDNLVAIWAPILAGHRSDQEVQLAFQAMADQRDKSWLTSAYGRPWATFPFNPSKG
jgi:hypothetical protein